MLIDLEALAQYELRNEADAAALIAEIGIELQIMGKRLKKTINEMKEILTEKFWKEIKSWSQSVADAFKVDSLADYAKATALFGEEFADALYGLQVRISQFRLALIGIAEPIVKVLLPVAELAVDILTGLANSIAQAVRMLFLGTTEADSFAASITGVSTASAALKRSLAGFDQLNRLSGQSASGGLSSLITAKPLTGKWQQVADKLTQLLEPLRKIDLTPAAESFQKLTAALEPIKRELFAGLEWAWNNLFVPLAKWTVEELLPVFLELLAESLNALGRVIEELKPMLTWLWEECLKPLAAWAGDQLIAYLQGLIQQLTGVSDWIGENQNPVDKLIQSGKNFITTLGNMASNTLLWEQVTTNASQALGGLMDSALSAASPLGSISTALSGVQNMTGLLANSFSSLLGASNQTWQSMEQVWSNLWENLKKKAMDPTYSGVKSTVNGMIGLTNGMLKAAAGGINGLSNAVNKLSFRVPDWIPVLGGKQFGFGLQPVTVPQIPYLAKGAVLPANKPFMAVLGDQRHGTNIEAPLATIEEAVAAVLDNQIGGVMAGFQAVTDRQERILQAILGLDLSDSAIAGAAERYQRKMAVVTGGY